MRFYPIFITGIVTWKSIVTWKIWLKILKKICYYCYFFLWNWGDIDFKTWKLGTKDLPNSGSERFTKVYLKDLFSELTALPHIRSISPGAFYEKGVLKYVAKFTGKHLGLFLIKLHRSQQNVINISAFSHLKIITWDKKIFKL